jgi:2-oxoglutarate dehydrogenase E2 component (dihydrolipoamide succinyltransferase)
MSKIVDVVVPTVGESVTEIFEVRILKGVGEYVKEGEVLLEGDSDKASIEIVSPTTGQVAEILVEEGADFPIGNVIAKVEEKAIPKQEVSKDVSAEKTPVAEEAAVQTVAETPAKSVSAVSEPPKTVTPVGGEKRVKMTPLRRTIARRLVEAQQTAAMLTTFNEADMTAIFALRKKYQERFVERHGTKLGFMSFFVKAIVDALQAYPAVNAEVDGNYIVYKNFYNIGVAVSGPKGLMVPVVRNADQLSFSEVELEIKRLAGLARNNKLKPHHFQEGTFTVSNGGVFGSLLSTPILNPPQSAILGMHTIQERPVNVNGNVEIRPMMYLAVSYDHRIIDGKEAVSFLVRIKELVENPERLLFDV